MAKGIRYTEEFKRDAVAQVVIPPQNNGVSK